jgi:hypothetical protein
VARQFVKLEYFVDLILINDTEIPYKRMSYEIPNAEELPTSMLSECKPITDCVSNILSQANAAIRSANEGYRSSATVDMTGLFPKLPSINGSDVQAVCLAKVVEELEEKNYQVSIIVPRKTPKLYLDIRWSITDKAEEIEEAKEKLKSLLRFVDSDI